MTLHVQSFATASDMVVWANANALTHANTQQIVEKDGAWWLFYWA